MLQPITKNMSSNLEGSSSIYIGSSQRGRQKLYKDGQEYNIKRINKDGTTLWRCFQKLICFATVKTDPEMRLLNETEHSEVCIRLRPPSTARTKAQLITMANGATVLLYDGYTFNRMYATKGFEKWHCSCFRLCKCFLVTDQLYRIHDCKVDHNHERRNLFKTADDVASRSFKTRFQRTPKTEVWLTIEEETRLNDSDDSLKDFEANIMPKKGNIPDSVEDSDEIIRPHDVEEESSENDASEDEYDSDQPLKSLSTPERGQTAVHFIGKNGFLWSKSELGEPSETPARKIKHESHPTESKIFESYADIWSKLFDDDMIATIVANTNVKIQENRAKLKTMRVDYKDTDDLEIRSLLGLLYYSAVFRCNNTDVSSLFATDGTSHEIFRMIMSNQRFVTLLNYLRFDNAEDRQVRLEADPLATVSYIFEKLFTNSQKHYALGPKTCINEMLLPFRGRCKFITYMPKKPRYGIKIRILSEADKPYAYNAHICCGNSDGRYLSEAERKLDGPTQAVIRLTKPIEYTSRNVTADSRFSSMQLMEVLHSKNLTYLGTLKRKNPVIPREFQPNKTRQPGTNLYGFTNDCTILSHVPKINKAVILVSSSHHEPSTDEVTNQPTMIADYNRDMSGFEEIERQCAIYSCARRAGRWSMAVFYRILDLAGVNAYVLYQGYPDAKLNRGDFLLSLARELVLPSLKKRVYNDRLPRDLRLNIKRVLGKDLPPAALPPPQSETEYKRISCRACPSRVRRKTRFCCCACNKPICLQCSTPICEDCRLQL